MSAPMFQRGFCPFARLSAILEDNEAVTTEPAASATRRPHESESGGDNLVHRCNTELFPTLAATCSMTVPWS